MRTCSSCARQVEDDVVVCPQCSSAIVGVAVTEKFISTYGVSKGKYNLYTLVSVLFPPVGIIIGINFFAKPGKPNKKFGESLIVWGLFMIFVYYVFWKLLSR